MVQSFLLIVLFALLFVLHSSIPSPSASVANATPLPKHKHKHAHKHKHHNRQSQGGQHPGRQHPKARYTAQSGMATWYRQDNQAGSCGWQVDDNAMVAALPQSIGYNRYCGRKVRLINHENGKAITVQASDTCPGCESNHIDLSRGAFAALSDGDFDKGVLNVKWAVL